MLANRKARQFEQHARLVDGIIRAVPGAQTTSFMKAVASLPDAAYTRDLCRHDPEWVEEVRIVPDAYLVDEENRTIVVFEAVVTSDVTESKLAKVAEIGWAIDQDSWSILLVRVDQHGWRGYLPQMAELMATVVEPSMPWSAFSVSALARLTPEAGR